MARAVTLRVVEGHARQYRHTWRGTTFSTLVTPVLFLSAMGLGLGSLVDASATQTLGGVDYLTWLAPGLLAAAAMQNGAGDGSFPVIAGIKWEKTYQAALNTPVRPADLTLGNLLWAVVRASVAALVYVVVATAFGAMHLGRGLLAIAPAVVTAAGFCAWISAVTAQMKTDQGLAAIQRFFVMPLFLFAGTFFPVSQLPDAIERFVWLVPLWHGVELARALSLGTTPTGPWGVHVAVVVGFLALGVVLSVWSFGRRLHR
ncbi:ABC transporter permease [Egicoccus halophilus]|uniref:Transport permease protein n=1 Tax=Egicoccus halophilus TaxID=1670830 RepID=A0A8J3A882_9ACTN|nr:ABC transporter permease [Egicoccus halophilus]GGI06232.1 transport permease protein [Egicoccus halophilus]